jgi:hypothetical protein
MAQKKDLNISPYYDDFDPSKNFYKVLFKPGFPVQARELTGLQSILQNQVEDFGSHIFKEGSMVEGGHPTYDRQYNAVKLNSTQFGIDISVYINELLNKTVEGQSSGVIATVDFIALPDGGEVEDLTIYVKYGAAGSTDPTLDTFIDGESLIVKENITYGNTTINAGTAVATLIASNALATGSAANISKGIYFIKGTFVNVDQQTIILDYYTNNPSYRIGLQINEEIITAKDDPSLYDNAKGFTNFAAPGADRFKISLTLTKKLIEDKNDTNFFEILRTVEGEKRIIKDTTEYSRIANWIARRTYDESGDYAVDPFDISVDNSLNNRLGNGGLFFEGQNTDEGNTPSKDLMCVKVSGGRAYVRGYDIKTGSVEILDVDKPRDVQEVSTTSVDFEMGNIFTVNNVQGAAQYRKVVNLYGELQRGTGVRGIMGQARVYSHNLADSTYKGAATKWNLRLYDIHLYTQLFVNRIPVAADLSAGYQVKGLRSGTIGYAVDTPTESAGLNSLLVRNATGSFVAGEPLAINGMVDVPLSIESLREFNLNDVQSVFQSAGGGYDTAFTADAFLQEVSFPGGATVANFAAASGGFQAVTSSGHVFDGVNVGDTIIFQGTAATADPHYNRIIHISDDLKTLTITEIKKDDTSTSGDDVAGVYNHALVTGARENIAISLGIPKWTGTGALYEPLPNSNISSVNFEGSNLSITSQLTGIDIATAGVSTIFAATLTDGAGVGISTAFFDAHNSTRYSISYKGGGIGTVRSDNFELKQNGSVVEFSDLSPLDDGVFTITATKIGIQSKMKQYEKSLLHTVTLSRNSSSGTTADSTLNDGLTYNKKAYGLRVQDEEISLNVPDVVKVLAVYESISETGAQPNFDVIEFTSTADVNTNAKIGENIIGKSSNAIARVVTNNESTPASGSSNKLGVVYLNDRKFTKSEEVTFEESNIVTNIEDITLGTYQDITKSFNLDKGQKDEFYDYSRLVRKSNVAVPSKQLLIVYDAYTVPLTDTGDVFTVLSYPEENFESDIPNIGVSRIRATDTLDFRPRVSTFTGTTSSPFDFAARTTAFNTVPKFIVAPNETSLIGYGYYLARIDKVYLDEYGKLSITKGISSLEPQAPNLDKRVMELATIELPPYLYNPDNARITLQDNRRYTMRDIGTIEDRVEELERVTTLSLLEVRTEALTVQDANGKDMFKSGFFVDPFNNNEFIDLDLASIEVDQQEGCIRPIIARNSLQNYLLPSSNIIDQEYDAGTNYPLLDSNVQKTGQAVTLKYDEVDWISQDFATKVENVNPFHVIAFRGNVELTPSSDSWQRTIRLENNVQEINTSRDEVENVEIFNRTWGTQEMRWSDTTTNIVSNTTTNTVSSDIIIDSGEDQFMRSRNTAFSISAVRPLNRHYQFFDGNSDVDFIPKLLEIANDSTLVNSGSTGTFQVGETVKGYSNNNEIINFRVAKSNHKFGAFNDPSTTYIKNPYDSSQNLQTEYTSTSKILNVDTIALASEAQGLYSGYVLTGTRLVGQTSGAIAYVKDLKLISDEFGDLQGSFFLKDPNADPQPSVVIRTGRKTYRVTSSSTNVKPLPGSKLISSAQTDYQSTGTFEISQLNTTITNTTVNTITNTTVTTIQEEEDDDPLAQSFMVAGNIEAPTANTGSGQDDDGVYLTSIDLFFARKDEGNNPVVVQIRTVELGTPTRNRVGKSVVLRPSDITISDTASIATNAKFPEPIYLEPGNEYAIVLLAPTSNQYEVWVGEFGKETIESQQLPDAAAVTYNQQWALGSLFLSQNGSTWSPVQTEDLKFKLYKAQFVSRGTVFFTNPTLNVSNGYETLLPSNSLVTLPKTGKIGISTLVPVATGDIGITTLSSGRKLLGATNSNVTATIVGAGNSINRVSIANSGNSYVTVNNVDTYAITGRGSGLKINITAVEEGIITGFTTVTSPKKELGNGYQVGDILGIVTSTAQNQGYGARITVTDVGEGTDTLFLSNIQGTTAAGGFVKDGAIRYVNGGTTYAPTNSPTYRTNLVVDGTPYNGNTIRIEQFDHGMHSNSNKVQLKNIKGNTEPTQLTSDLTDGEVGSISVGSTSQFNHFEGVIVGAANTGYLKVGDEIIGYKAIVAGAAGAGTLTIDDNGRGIDDTRTQLHEATSSIVEKYELNGISLRRINTSHTISNHNIDLDSYFIDIDRSSNGRYRNADVPISPQVSFTNEGFFGGNGGTASRNIQFESLVPNYNLLSPTAKTRVSASIRTVSGTSIGGNEVSFIDQGYEPLELNALNILSTPRIVCSKVNETEYLGNMQRNKSFTTAIEFETNNESISPIIYLDSTFTEFRSNRLNNPVADYATNDLVKSKYYDPHTAIYVSDKIMLDKPADGLKVFLTAYRDTSSDFRVLYSLVRSESDAESDNFNLFPGYDNLDDTSGDGFGDRVINPADNNGKPDSFVKGSASNEYREYQFSNANLGLFFGYRIKIVMSGTNQAHPVKIKDLRTIALK